MIGRILAVAFFLLIAASTYEHWTRPPTRLVTACWTPADNYDEVICRGAYVPTGARD
jgi:hypothetical protein